MNVNNNNEINIESKTMSMLLITVPYDIFIRKRWNVFFVLKKTFHLNPLTQISRNATFCRSQYARYAGTLCIDVCCIFFLYLSSMKRKRSSRTLFCAKMQKKNLCQCNRTIYIQFAQQQNNYSVYIQLFIISFKAVTNFSKAELL